VIKYALKCAEQHHFEGWFSSSADFDRQKSEALLECPICGSSIVEKALMAPAIVKSGSVKAPSETLAKLTEEWNAAAKKAQDYVAKNFEHVGKKFPEEARRQHYGETKAAPIYGEATPNEVRELKQEGVSVAPVPEPISAPSETKKKMN